MLVRQHEKIVDDICAPTGHALMCRRRAEASRPRPRLGMWSVPAKLLITSGVTCPATVSAALFPELARMVTRPRAATGLSDLSPDDVRPASRTPGQREPARWVSCSGEQTDGGDGAGEAVLITAARRASAGDGDLPGERGWQVYAHARLRRGTSWRRRHAARCRAGARLDVTNAPPSTGRPVIVRSGAACTPWSQRRHQARGTSRICRPRRSGGSSRRTFREHAVVRGSSALRTARRGASSCVVRPAEDRMAC